MHYNAFVILKQLCESSYMVSLVGDSSDFLSVHRNEFFLTIYSDVILILIYKAVYMHPYCAVVLESL